MYKILPFCFYVLSYRGDVEEDSDLESNSSLYEEPPMPRGRGEMAKAAEPKSQPLRNRGPRRPDKALYMPRAARERLSFQGSPASTGQQRVTSPGSSGCGCTVSSTTSGSCCLCSSCSDATEVTRSSSGANQESLLPSTSDIDSAAADSRPSCPQDQQEDVVLKLCEAAPCPSPPALDQTVSYFMYMTLEEACSGVPDSPHTAETTVEETTIEETSVEETSVEDGTADFSEEVRLNTELLSRCDMLSFQHILSFIYRNALMLLFWVPIPILSIENKV